MSRVLICDCVQFGMALMEFCKKILPKGDGWQQWKAFEQFLMKHVDNQKRFGRRGRGLDAVDGPRCSREICDVLLDGKLDEFRHCDVALSTLLVDLVTVSHYYGCYRRDYRWVRDFAKTPSYSKEHESMRFVAMLNRKSDFTKLLFDFGFLSDVPRDSPYLREALDEHFNLLMFLITRDNPKRLALVEQAKEFGKLKKDCPKRAYLALAAIQYIQPYQKGYDIVAKGAAENVSRLRMCFAAIPDDFLSISEVRGILYPYLKLANKLDMLNVYCQELEQLMPECPAEREPRKLTHLARCQIRQSLKMSRLPLPSAIHKLLLPKRLKEFLSGKILDIPEKSRTQSKLM